MLSDNFHAYFPHKINTFTPSPNKHLQFTPNNNTLSLHSPPKTQASLKPNFAVHSHQILYDKELQE
jgi:hypothetical protein